MRRAAWSLPAGAITFGLIVSIAPAPAGADALEELSGLASRHLSPAPLVFTTAPRSLTPLESTIQGTTSRRRSGYAIRLVHYGPNGPDAIVALERGAFKTVKATLRDDKRLGFKARPTRVRGHPGYLLTRHLGPTERELVWLEGGVVYSIGTGTPKKVSLKQLRATAEGLDSLGGHYLGDGGDPDNPSEGNVVTTGHTVTAEVDWGAQCVSPGGSGATARVGRSIVTALARRGNAFSYKITQHLAGEGAWSGTVSGTIASNAVTLNVRATATVDGQACDSGTQSFTIPRV